MHPQKTMRMVGVICAVTVFICDRFLKYLANRHQLKGHIGRLQFAWLHNFGAGGGILQHQLWLLTPLGVMAVIALTIYAFRVATNSFFFWFGWGLLVGGAADNTMDRVWHGYVTDMLQFTGDRFVFNLADEAIRYGTLMILLHLLIEAIHETLAKRKQMRQSNTG